MVKLKFSLNSSSTIKLDLRKRWEKIGTETKEITRLRLLLRCFKGRTTTHTHIDIDSRNKKAVAVQGRKVQEGKGRWWNQLIKSEAEVKATTSLPPLLKWKLITAMAFHSSSDVREPIITVLDDPAIMFFTIYYSLHETFCPFFTFHHLGRSGRWKELPPENQSDIWKPGFSCRLMFLEVQVQVMTLFAKPLGKTNDGSLKGLSEKSIKHSPALLSGTHRAQWKHLKEKALINWL